MQNPSPSFTPEEMFSRNISFTAKEKLTYLRFDQPVLLLVLGWLCILKSRIKRDFVLSTVEGCKAWLFVVLLTDFHVEWLRKSFGWDLSREEHITLGKTSFILSDNSALGKAWENRDAKQKHD